MIVIKLAEYSAWLEKRKAELGLTGRDYVPKNSGLRRTPEKRALLKWIKDECEKKGKTPPFDANF